MYKRQVRIWAELIKLIFATVNVADYQESGARFAGAVLGHHQSLLKGKNGLEKQSERVTQALEWLDDELKRKLNKKAYRKMIAEGEKLAPDIDKFFEQFDKVLVPVTYQLTNRNQRIRPQERTRFGRWFRREGGKLLGRN